MLLKKNKLTELGESAVKAGNVLMTDYEGTTHRIVMACITDKQADILLKKKHPFIESKD
jgi:hypothetical protein